MAYKILLNNSSNVKKVCRRKSFNNAFIYIINDVHNMYSTPLKTLCVGNYAKSLSAHHTSCACTRVYVVLYNIICIHCDDVHREFHIR